MTQRNLCFFSLLAVLTALPAIAGERAFSPSEKAFVDLKARVLTEVEAGRLPATAKEEAEAIAFALHTRLIRAEADIEVGKLEVKRFTGEQQDAALDNLLRTVTERERSIFEHLRQLEQVAGAQAPEMKAADQGKEKNENTLEIVFEPEDPSSGEDP